MKNQNRKMAQVLKKSRKQVEESLRNRTSSIASRLEALESELPVPSKSIRRLTDRKTLLKAGAGLALSVVAYMVVIRFRRDPNREFRREIDHVSASIGKEIRKNLGRGFDEEEAVTRALEKRPPVLNIGAAGDSFWSSLMTQLSRHIAAALGPVIGEKIANRFRGKADEK